MNFDEQETVINFSRYHIGEWAEVYTSDKSVAKRYDRFCEKYPDHCKLIKTDKYGSVYSIHPKCAGIYPHAPRIRTMTEEQRKEIAERLHKARG